MAERTALGKRIAAACAMAGISMTVLADRIGVARNTLSRIVTGETANPASSIMVSIAQELGVSLDFLFGLSDGPEITRNLSRVAEDETSTSPATPPTKATPLSRRRQAKAKE
jgi:transcriptional regulator with XRE-family HTH domain